MRVSPNVTLDKLTPGELMGLVSLLAADYRRTGDDWYRREAEAVEAIARERWRLRA